VLPVRGGRSAEHLAGPEEAAFAPRDVVAGTRVQRLDRLLRPTLPKPIKDHDRDRRPVERLPPDARRLPVCLATLEQEHVAIYAGGERGGLQAGGLLMNRGGARPSQHALSTSRARQPGAKPRRRWRRLRIPRAEPVPGVATVGTMGDCLRRAVYARRARASVLAYGLAACIRASKAQVTSGVSPSPVKARMATMRLTRRYTEGAAGYPSGVMVICVRSRVP